MLAFGAGDQRSRAKRFFTPDGRIGDAGDGQALKEVAVAALVASRAQANGVGFVRMRLRCPVGVGDQCPHQRDGIGVFIGQDPFGFGRREDAVDGEDRN